MSKDDTTTQTSSNQQSHFVLNMNPIVERVANNEAIVENKNQNEKHSQIFTTYILYICRDILQDKEVDVDYLELLSLVKQELEKKKINPESVTSEEKNSGKSKNNEVIDLNKKEDDTDENDDNEDDEDDDDDDDDDEEDEDDDSITGEHDTIDLDENEEKTCGHDGNQDGEPVKKKRKVKRKTKNTQKGDQLALCSQEDEWHMQQQLNSEIPRLNQVILNIEERERNLQKSLLARKALRAKTKTIVATTKINETKKKKIDQYDYENDDFLDDTDYEAFLDLDNDDADNFHIRRAEEKEEESPKPEEKKRKRKLILANSKSDEDDDEEIQLHADMVGAIKDLEELIEKSSITNRTKSIPQEFDSKLLDIAKLRRQRYPRGVPKALIKAIRQLPCMKNFNEKTIKTKLKSLLEDYDVNSISSELEEMMEKLKDSIKCDLALALRKKKAKNNEENKVSDHNHIENAKKFEEKERADLKEKGLDEQHINLIAQAKIAGVKVKWSEQTTQQFRNICTKKLDWIKKKNSRNKKQKQSDEEASIEKEMAAMFSKMKQYWPTPPQLKKKWQTFMKELDKETPAMVSPSKSSSDHTKSNKGTDDIDAIEKTSPINPPTANTTNTTTEVSKSANAAKNSTIKPTNTLGETSKKRNSNSDVDKKKGEDIIHPQSVELQFINETPKTETTSSPSEKKVVTKIIKRKRRKITHNQNERTTLQSPPNSQGSQTHPQQEQKLKIQEQIPNYYMHHQQQQQSQPQQQQSQQQQQQPIQLEKRKMYFSQQPQYPPKFVPQNQFNSPTSAISSNFLDLTQTFTPQTLHMMSFLPPPPLRPPFANNPTVTNTPSTSLSQSSGNNFNSFSGSINRKVNNNLTNKGNRE